MLIFTIQFVKIPTIPIQAILGMRAGMLPDSRISAPIPRAQRLRSTPLPQPREAVAAHLANKNGRPGTSAF